MLFWLAVAGAMLSLPNIGLFYGLHHWTEATFGFGARTIAVIDAATASPVRAAQHDPAADLIAFYAPAGHRATWFALMASLMNMALVAGQLQTKYLNEIFVVGRGNYTELGPLLITAAVLGLVIPVARHRAVRPACLTRASARTYRGLSPPGERPRHRVSLRAGGGWLFPSEHRSAAI